MAKQLTFRDPKTGRFIKNPRKRAPVPALLWIILNSFAIAGIIIFHVWTMAHVNDVCTSEFPLTTEVILSEHAEPDVIEKIVYITEKEKPRPVVRVFRGSEVTEYEP